MRDAFIHELTLAAREDPRVFLVVGDLGYSVIEEFQAEFPDRFLNPGVAEQSMIGIAAGLAASGYSVFCYSIGNFPTMRPLEQIRNDVCYHDRSVTVVSVGGGFAYGYLGYTHHAIEDVAVMRALPGMTVFAPADAAETRVLVRAAVENGGPHYLRLGKNGEPKLHLSAPSFDSLRSGAVLREGSDIVLLASGPIAGKALAAADVLAERGVYARVVSVPVIKPIGFDPALLLGTAAGIVTIEEHSLHGGLASAVLEAAAVAGTFVPLIPVYADEALAGKVIGSQAYIQDRTGLALADILSAADRLLTAARD